LEEQRSRFFVMVGGSGLGKTSLLTRMPKVLVIMDDRETGVLDLMQVPGAIPPDVQYGKPLSTWIETMKALDDLIAAGGPQFTGRQSLLVESITGFERMMMRYACEKDWGGNYDRFMDYSKGPIAAAKRYWSDEFLDRLKVLRNQGYHVAITAHSQPKPKDNPEGENFTGEMPYCNRDVWQQTHAQMEAVCFMVQSAVVEKKGVMGAGKAALTGTRMIHVATSPIYTGKNRWAIPDGTVIPMSGGPDATWLAFCETCGFDPQTFYFK
jgi:hypothetical protein